MRVAITGHRPNRLGNEWDHSGPYSDYVWYRMIDIVKILKPDQMISGMALGADFLWARVARRKKIPLIATVPFKGQERRWNQDHQDEYRDIINDENTKLIITAETISKTNATLSEKYKHRDRITVGHCQILVAVMSDPKSGTGYTVKYAREKDIPVILIDPEGWKT